MKLLPELYVFVTLLPCLNTSRIRNILCPVRPSNFVIRHTHTLSDIHRYSNSRVSSTRLLVLPGEGQTSQEESLNLRKGITADAFLDNIITYGKARMARRAVGLLEKMKAYRVNPSREHYNAAIWACESSNQYEQARSVLKKMKADKIVPDLRTYEGLITCAEKADNWEGAFDLIEEMRSQNIIPNTAIYNAVMLTCDRGGHCEKALQLLREMEEDGVPRDAVTYAALTWAMEKESDGETALHILELMRADNIEMNIPTYNAAIWACVKGHLWEDALKLFNEIKTVPGLRPDLEAYNGAIWACEQGHLYDRAVDLLREMKLDGVKRDTKSFDGALFALQKAGKWEKCIELMQWMSYDNIPKQRGTYTAVLTALQEAGQEELLFEQYANANREGHFLPWVPNTRTMDLRDFPSSLAKVAIRSVLLSMKEGKQALFNLNIIIGEEPEQQQAASGDTEETVILPADNSSRSLATVEVAEEGEATYATELNPNTLIDYVRHMDPTGQLQAEYFVDEENWRKILIPRDAIVNWVKTVAIA